MKQEMMGFWNRSGISWTIYKQSAPCFRQMTTPTPHNSIVTGRALFQAPNQQCQITEGTESPDKSRDYLLLLVIVVSRRETELAAMYEARHEQRRKSAAYTSPSSSDFNCVSDPEVLPVRRQLRDVEPRRALPPSVCHRTGKFSS